MSAIKPIRFAVSGSGYIGNSYSDLIFSKLNLESVAISDSTFKINYSNVLIDVSYNAARRK